MPGGGPLSQRGGGVCFGKGWGRGASSKADIRPRVGDAPGTEGRLEALVDLEDRRLERVERAIGLVGGTEEGRMAAGPLDRRAQRERVLRARDPAHAAPPFDEGRGAQAERLARLRHREAPQHVAREERQLLLAQRAPVLYVRGFLAAHACARRGDGRLRARETNAQHTVLP